MTKFKKVALGCIGLFILAALPLASAQNAPVPDGSSPKWHPGGIYSQLNLSDEQKKELEANKQQHRARMEIDRQEIRTARQELQEELMKTQLDMPRVRALHEQIKAVQSQMEDIKLNAILAVRTILTSDQFSKFVYLMKKRKQERGE